ncbi:MATH/TRAF domain-containing protein [Hirschfeldia incana]|nr:MATH/TRAF domain-containing protein [Hirschfeldia incana]
MDNKKVSLGFIFVALLFITSSARSAEFIIQQVTEGRGTEYNRSYSLNENPGVTRVFREERPSSKIVTITSFSTVHTRPVPYESSVFEAAGYKWRLVLYVIGKKDDGGDDHVSLYVRIEDTSSFPEGWEVDVDLKLFVHNPKLHKYLSVTDGIVKRFNDGNKEWGYGQLIPLSTFRDTNEGYIVDDTCSFGAEIFVIKQAEVQEKVTFINNPANSVFTWRVEHFSTLQNKYYYSDEFLVGDRYWRLGFIPRTSGATLPIYLYAQGFKADAVVTNTYGGGNLRLKNQLGGNDRQRYSAAWYPIRSGYGMGVSSIISLKDLNDASKGYLVNDSIIFEVEMVKVSVTNIVPV